MGRERGRGLLSFVARIERSEIRVGNRPMRRATTQRLWCLGFAPLNPGDGRYAVSLRAGPNTASNSRCSASSTSCIVAGQPSARKLVTP
jgi:hypothetical protein